MKFTIYHNPRCSKSRQTLELLQSRNVQPEIIEYLATPPDARTLKAIVDKLGVSPREILRRNEEPVKAAGNRVEKMTDEELLAWLAENPIAIQRPIVVTETAARIGRPPEAVLDILPGNQKRQ